MNRNDFLTGPTRAQIREEQEKADALAASIQAAKDAATKKRIAALEKKKNALEQRLTVKQSALPRTVSYGGCGGGGGCGR